MIIERHFLITRTKESLMNAFNNSLAGTLGLLLISTYSPAFATPADISGNYQCTYYDLGDTSKMYTEKMTIKKNGTVYNVQVFGKDAVIPYELGTAIFNTEVDNAFAFVFWNIKDSTTYGSEIFVIKSDGSLDGAFSYNNNNNKPGIETCTKLY